jgi:citrate synthase
VVALLEEAARVGGPMAAVGSWLRQGRTLPGFGHPLYDGADPRGAAMLELVGSLTAGPSGGATTGPSGGLVAGERWEVVTGVISAAARHTPARPNSDFGLGALAFVTAMPADAGAAIFAIARAAGWIAHAIEEYRETPLRLRGRALYTGLAPAHSDVPFHPGRVKRNT